MRLFKIFIGFTLGLTPLFINAQEDELRFKIGASYRHFDDIDFKNFELRNFNNATVPAGPFGIQGFSGNQFSNTFTQPISIDYVTYNGSDDSENSTGPTLGIEFPLGDGAGSGFTEGSSELNFVANFSFFSIQSGDSETGTSTNLGNFSSRIVQHSVVAGSVNEVTQDTFDNGVSGLSPSSTVNIENDLDAELYVFDVGLRNDWDFEHLILGVSAGPTLTLGDVDTEQNQSGSFLEPETNGTLSYNEAKSDSDFDVVLGLYISVEAGFELNESVGISVGYRYDLGFDDIGTSQAEVDLNTHGGFARLAISF